MTPDRPILSVVTPVLNGGAHFASCLRSVRRLADAVPGAIEHVIADGGSDDETFALARRAENDAGSPVSCVLAGPDRGQSHGINRAVAVSRGDWIGWLNADDVYDPRAAALVRAFAVGEHSDVDVVVGRCRFVDRSGRVVFAPVPPRLETAEPLLRPLSRWFAGRCIVQPEALIRRSAFERVGGLDEGNHLAMDHDLWLRLFEAGARFTTIDLPVAEQLVHPGQKTADNIGVAAAILRSCDQHLSHQRGGGFAGVDDELAELRKRLALVSRVLESPRGVAPFSRQAAHAAMQDVVDRITQPSGVTLVVGQIAWDHARSAGWDLSRVARSSPSAVPPGGMDAIVMDCLGGASSGASPGEAIRALRPGGTAFLVGCSRTADLSRAQQAIRRALADRVTWQRQPWSDHLIETAGGLIGWVHQRLRTAVGTQIAATRTLNNAVPRSRLDPRLLETLGVRPADLASTLVVVQPK